MGFQKLPGQEARGLFGEDVQEDLGPWMESCHSQGLSLAKTLR